MKNYPRAASGIRVRQNFNRWYIYKTSRYMRYETNDIGITLLKLCDGTRSGFAIAKEVSERYKLCKTEVIDFLSRLQREGIIEFGIERHVPIPFPIFDDIGPSWVVLHITNQCNLSCQHCYVDASPNRKTELSTEHIFNCLSMLAKMGTIDVILTGGEPLIRPDFVQIIKYISSLGMSSEILTNGTLVTRKMAKNIAECGVDQVLVSLDAPVPDIHDKLRGITGSWSSALSGIRNLKSVGVKVVVNTVMCQVNLPYLLNMFPLLSELKIDSWRLGSLFYVGRAVSNKMIAVQVSEYLNVLSEIDSTYFSSTWPFTLTTTLDWESIALSKDEMTERYHICGMTIGKHLYIRANGDVLVCDRLPNLRVGNILNEPISKIWARPLVQQWKNCRVDEIKVCKQCRWKYLCGAGCRANALRYCGDFYAPDPIACMTIQENVENRWNYLPGNVQDRLLTLRKHAEESGSRNGPWPEARNLIIIKRRRISMNKKYRKVKVKTVGTDTGVGVNINKTTSQKPMLKKKGSYGIVVNPGINCSGDY